MHLLRAFKNFTSAAGIRRVMVCTFVFSIHFSPFSPQSYLFSARYTNVVSIFSFLMHLFSALCVNLMHLFSCSRYVLSSRVSSIYVFLLVKSGGLPKYCQDVADGTIKTTSATHHRQPMLPNQFGILTQYTRDRVARWGISSPSSCPRRCCRPLSWIVGTCVRQGTYCTAGADIGE